MRNDYTDYIQHAFGHKYVAKVKTASGNKYFYTQEEYDAYRRGSSGTSSLGTAINNTINSAAKKVRGTVGSTTNRVVNGRPAGIHQTPTRGASGAAYTVKKKVNSFGTSIRDAANSAAKKVRGTVGSTTNRVVNGRPAGIHQTPTRGASGAAYTVKRSASNAVKSASASIGSKQIKNAYGPSAPVSVMANHKKNQASLRYNAAADKVRNKVNNAKTAVNDATTKVRNKIALEKYVASNKINALEYKVSKKIDSLVSKNKKISSNLANKMKSSVEKLRKKLFSSGYNDEQIKMMNDKLDRIIKEIDANKTVKNTGSHPAYNQGVVTYKEYKPTQGSRPTNNQGYVSKADRKIAERNKMSARDAAYDVTSSLINGLTGTNIKTTKQRQDEWEAKYNEVKKKRNKKR